MKWSFVSLDPPVTSVLFPTDGDMLEYLHQNGEIQEKDGLYATWYHAVNSKAETEKAVESKYKILSSFHLSWDWFILLPQIWLLRD